MPDVLRLRLPDQDPDVTGIAEASQGGAAKTRSTQNRRFWPQK